MRGQAAGTARVEVLADAVAIEVGLLAVIFFSPMAQSRKRVVSDKSGGKRRVRTLERGLTVLEVLASRGEMSLAEVASASNLAVSTAYRLLETLAQRDFVLHSPARGTYAVGVRAFEVGSAFLSMGRLSSAAGSEMTLLAETVGETVNLAILDGREAIYVHQVEGKQRVRMFTQVGARAPLHCTGVGKALLCALSDGEILALFGSGRLPAYTAASKTDRQSVLEDIHLTLERGYALDLQEYDDEVCCVAAPIFDQSGIVAGALSVSGPSNRMPVDRLVVIGRDLLSTTTRISRRLGFVSRDERAPADRRLENS